MCIQVKEELLLQPLSVATADKAESENRFAREMGPLGQGKGLFLVYNVNVGQQGNDEHTEREHQCQSLKDLHMAAPPFWEISRPPLSFVAYGMSITCLFIEEPPSAVMFFSKSLNGIVSPTFIGL